MNTVCDTDPSKDPSAKAPKSCLTRYLYLQCPPARYTGMSGPNIIRMHWTTIVVQITKMVNLDSILS